MREAGCSLGRKGLFYHHRVDRSVLCSLAAELDALAQTAPRPARPRRRLPRRGKKTSVKGIARRTARVRQRKRRRALRGLPPSQKLRGGTLMFTLVLYAAAGDFF
jgi:hypothetical protein